VRKFIDTVLVKYGYDPHMHIGNMSKQQRHDLASLLGNGIPLTLLQRRPGDEFVTAGGVSLDEVEPKSGQSRIVP
jgi:predicted flavoprotein YhiN